MNQRHFLFPISPFTALIGGMIGSLGLVLACGRADPGFLSEPLPPVPVVRLADSQGDGEARRAISGSYLVMFREERAPEKLFFASFADEYAHHYAALNEEHDSDPRVKTIDILTAVDMSGLRAVEWEPDFALPKVMGSLLAGFDDDSQAGVLARVDFENDADAAAVLGEWERSGKIWFAEPNETSDLFAGELAQWGTDYDAMQEWHKTVKLPDAFKSLAEGKLSGAASEADLLANSPLIAVLDSGVDYEHPQLKDNIWTNSSVGAAGCAGDIHGCNTTVSSRGSLGNGEVWPVLASGPGESCVKDPTQSGCDHGTHVAGIIAAKPDSSQKVGGVCPVCKIMILRVADVEAGDTSGDPSIRDDSQIRAYKYLTRFRKGGGSAVRIVNASIGKYSRSRSVAILVDVLKRVGSGTILIGAASNEDSMIRSYPAALANAIAVSAVGSLSSSTSVEKAPFSNFGPWVDIAAPGVNIKSTTSGGNVAEKSGTSMAAPVVSGAAGLLLAAYPNLSFNEIRDLVLNTASASRLYGSDAEGGPSNTQYYYPKVSGEAVRRPLLGGGLLDVNAMISKSKSTSTGQPLERVTAGCGVIGVAHSPGSIWAAISSLALPVLMALLWRRRNDG